MFKLSRYLKDFKKQVIIGPIFKLTEAIFELIVPLVMANIIDIGAKNGDFSYVLKMGAVMVLLGVLGLCCALVCQYNAAKASQGFGTVLRRELFAHISSLSYAELDKIGTPELITRMTNDINQLQLAVAMLIRLVIRAPFLVIGAATISIFIDIKLSLIFFIAIILIVLVLYFVMSRCVPLYKNVQEHLDKTSLISRENLIGIRVIRAFSKQKNEIARFEDTTESMQKAAIRVGKLSALLNPLTLIITNVAIIAIVWFGASFVNTGDLLQGQIIALVQYMNQILLALVVVANLVVIFTKAHACAKRVNEVFDLKPSINDGDGATTENINNDISVFFDNVTFSYNKDSEAALKDFTLSVKKGETIGIIGGTGSGKSTLVNLIPRFYDPIKGNVFINGINAKEYSLKELRDMIGIVLQRAVLFSGDIKSNLLLSNENASLEDINRALDIAQASEFVNRFEDKLDHKIEQDGRNLSGGQRQRLTIARALIRKPQILILDDSFSALDFATDAALRTSLAKNVSDATIFIVSQRASSIKNADKIVVLDEGDVAGIGTHDELIKSCDVYKEICLSQQSVKEA